MYTILLLILLFNPISSSSDHYFKSHASTNHSRQNPQEYIELTHPSPSDQLTPTCTLSILNHSFAHTMDSPPISVPYSPPSDLPSLSWSRVVLDLSVTCRGEQYDRIAGLWLGGVELLRTSTAEPTEFGIFWKVQKDITKYSSLLNRSDLNFTMMMENVVNDVFTGIYHVNVSFLFYDTTALSVPLGLVKQLPRKDLNGEIPADFIIPVSESDGEERGFWFRIERESDAHSKVIQIPLNSVRVVLELYVSFHGNDEFWYSNPSNSYIKENNLTTGRGNGAYREVYVMIDGEYVASVLPFPVIFTGGINPIFWDPVVAIGAFNLPTYDIELTPFLGRLLDNKSHIFTIGVSDGISFWLVDANLHVWVDHDQSSEVQAMSVHYQQPTRFKKRVITKFQELDGSFKIEAKRESQFGGWVKSKEGNLTTRVLESFKFKNKIRFEKNGTFKYVKQRIKVKKEVRLETETGVLIDQLITTRKYPLNVITITENQVNASEPYSIITNISHALLEKISGGKFETELHNSQESSGWMRVMDHSVLAGEAQTNQSLSYEDESGCYVRSVVANNGWLVSDNSTLSCVDSM